MPVPPTHTHTHTCSQKSNNDAKHDVQPAHAFSLAQQWHHNMIWEWWLSCAGAGGLNVYMASSKQTWSKTQKQIRKKKKNPAPSFPSSNQTNESKRWGIEQAVITGEHHDLLLTHSRAQEVTRESRLWLITIGPPWLSHRATASVTPDAKIINAVAVVPGPCSHGDEKIFFSPQEPPLVVKQQLANEESVSVNVW